MRHEIESRWRGASGLFALPKRPLHVTLLGGINRTLATRGSNGQLLIGRRAFFFALHSAAFLSHANGRGGVAVAVRLDMRFWGA